MHSHYEEYSVFYVCLLSITIFHMHPEGGVRLCPSAQNLPYSYLTQSKNQSLHHGPPPC